MSASARILVAGHDFGGLNLLVPLLTLGPGTILVGAVMTTAILTAHARNGIWNHEGGFEFSFIGRASVRPTAGNNVLGEQA